MEFFLPLATTRPQAERIDQRIREQLTLSGFEVKPQRIYQVSYREAGQLRTQTVGMAAPNGELVLAIFQNDIGYCICTYSTGAVWGLPMVARYLAVESVERFEQ